MESSKAWAPLRVHLSMGSQMLQKQPYCCVQFWEATLLGSWSKAPSALKAQLFIDAAMKNQLDKVAWLLSRNVTVNARCCRIINTPYGVLGEATQLHAAVHGGSRECCAVLLDEGADPLVPAPVVAEQTWGRTDGTGIRAGAHQSMDIRSWQSRLTVVSLPNFTDTRSIAIAQQTEMSSTRCTRCQARVAAARGATVHARLGMHM